MFQSTLMNKNLSAIHYLYWLFNKAHLNNFFVYQKKVTEKLPAFRNTNVFERVFITTGSTHRVKNSGENKIT